VAASQPRWLNTVLAWYFVVVWGSGFVATKIALQHAAPFTLLSLRFACGIACLIPVVVLTRPRWPASRTEFSHVVVAGLLMHATNLGGSLYSQYQGMPAGIVAVLMCAQPLITAAIAARWMGEKPGARQWLGVTAGLAGVVLIVWHKIDMHEASTGALLAVGVALLGVTAGSLYQRTFCARVDLRTAALLQFAATLAVMGPLALLFEDNHVTWSASLFGALAFLVICGSLLAVNAWHYLLRHGGITRVTSLIYLTPVFAIVPEYLFFGVVPSAVSWIGIVVTCGGVALAAWRRPTSAPAAGQERPGNAPA
jgi:drug/metabolite transporter (DMT)-like permease